MLAEATLGCTETKIVLTEKLYTETEMLTFLYIVATLNHLIVFF